MNIPRSTFRKCERLKRKKIISDVFSSRSRTVLSRPIRMSWIETELPVSNPAQVLISVSKKNFPRSVDRNYIKRLLREVYRKNKHLIYDFLNERNIQCAIVFGYSGKEMFPYSEIESQFPSLFEKFKEQFAK